MVINGGLMVINGDLMVINGGLMVINGGLMVMSGDLPSGKHGKLTVCYWKLSFNVIYIIVDLPMEHGEFPYGSLPEGIHPYSLNIFDSPVMVDFPLNSKIKKTMAWHLQESFIRCRTLHTPILNGKNHGVFRLKRSLKTIQWL